jgi:hypothetical protein
MQMAETLLRVAVIGAPDIGPWESFAAWTAFSASTLASYALALASCASSTAVVARFLASLAFFANSATPEPNVASLASTSRSFKFIFVAAALHFRELQRYHSHFVYQSLQKCFLAVDLHVRNVLPVVMQSTVLTHIGK